MIEWIDLLTLMGIGMAAMALLLAFIILVQFARRLLIRVKPKKVILVQPKETRKEKPKMSKEAKEGVTFNDIFMFMIAVPLVLLWVGFAGFVIHTGLNNSAVLENIEAYTTLIAILGGPALLIIKDALDVWKQEQAEKTAFYKVKAQSVIDYNDSMQKQAQMIEAKAQEQEHKIENKK
jgi:sterol desaturase/sphingolipid hydroxylase (fatty acid hydroxylase superfamily)